MWYRVFIVSVISFLVILGAPASAQENPTVVMETRLGSITIELLESDAPKKC